MSSVDKQVKVVATKQFEQGVKMLKKKHDNEALSELYEVVTQLRSLNVSTQNKNHWLKNADGHLDIHIKGGNLILLYKYIGGESDDIALVVTLKLQDLIDHTELRRYDKKNYKASAHDYDVDDIKSTTDIAVPLILRDKKYVFTLQGVNSSWDDDILLIAENNGAVKVKYDMINPSTGKFWKASGWKYAVSDLSTADDILQGCLEEHIPLKSNEINNISKVDWADRYNICIDDYEKGIYRVNYNIRRS